MEPEAPKVGIFGTGSLIRSLVPHIRRHFEVIAIWDEDDGQMEEEAESLNIGFSSPYVDDVLLHKEIGLLLILCDPIYHASIAVKALGIAKHVYVHPPCAISGSETLRMVQSAAYYPNLLAVVGSLRSLPAVCEMKRLITEQEFLGNEIIHCDVRLNSPSLIGNSRYSWKCSQEMGGGVLNFFGSHVIDLVIYLLSHKAVRVHAVSRTVQRQTQQMSEIRKITADDITSLVVETDANCLVTIHLSSQSCSFNQEVSITGNAGQLVLRNASLYGRKLVDNQGEQVLYQDEPDIEPDKHLGPGLPWLYLQGYIKLFDHLQQVLVSKKQEDKCHLASFEDALHVSEIISAARQSSLEKTWCRVQLMDH